MATTTKTASTGVKAQAAAAQGQDPKTAQQNQQSEEQRVNSLPQDQKENYDAELDRRIAEKRTQADELDTRLDDLNKELDQFRETRDQEIQKIEQYFREQEKKLQQEHEENKKQINAKYADVERTKLDDLDRLENHLERVRGQIRETETGAQAAEK